MIHSGQFIDIGLSEKSGILASTAELCEKVSLEIGKIKNINRIYEAYRIPKNENIVAFCKSGVFGLTVSGIIFTDKAFYPEPNSDTPKHIPYTDLCNYVISRRYDNISGDYLANHGGVFLRNSNNEYTIYSGTIIAKNTGAEEIFKILTAIQNELCRKNQAAKNRLDSTVGEIFDTYRNKMKQGNAQNSDNLILRTLQTNPYYYEKAILLFAENKYRLFNKEIYNQYINNLPVNDESLINKPKNPNLLFSKQYISDLSNIKLNIAENYLIKVSSNLESLDVYKENEYTIYALVLLRLKKFESAQNVINDELLSFGSNSVEIVENYRLVIGNQNMRKVYNYITKGESIPEDLLTFKDGLGLTPLHYKLILNSTDDIDDILDLKNWNRDCLGFREESLSKIYDYSLLAYIKNYKNLDNIIKYTDDKVKALNYYLEKIQSQAQAASDAIKEIDKCLIDARRRLQKLDSNNGSFSECYDIQNSIRELEYSREKSSKLLFECMRKIEQTNAKISKKIADKENNILADLQMLAHSNSPFIKMLLEIYENHNDGYNLKAYYSVKNTSEMKVYNYCGYRFLFPNDVIINSPYYSIHINDDGAIISDYYSEESSNVNTSHTRIYENSWFSDEAHSDLAKLIFEYRKLVKKYHPDVCKEANANDLFIEITEEYQSISSTLK